MRLLAWSAHIVLSSLTMFSSQLVSIPSCLPPLDVCPHFGIHCLVLVFVMHGGELLISVPFIVRSLFSPTRYDR